MNIRLEDCINQISSQQLRLIDHPTICFVSETYAPSFVTLLRSYYKQTYGVESSVVCDDALGKTGEHAPHNQISLFTNNIARFFIAFDLTDSKKNQLLKQLQTFDHQLSVIFAKESLSREHVTITIPKVVDAKLFAALATCMNIPISDKTMLTIKSFLVKNAQAITLEHACILLQYVGIMGSSFDQHIEHVFETIVRPEASLFMLSQYFFSKSASHFYRLWDSTQSLYPELFWITFWSEQLYRAAEYVSFQNYKQSAQAKQISYRLPFSFINTDWKKYSYDELSRAHECVYDLDYAFKNGQEVSLDILYHSFFSDFFA